MIGVQIQLAGGAVPGREPQAVIIILLQWYAESGMAMRWMTLG
jgi:hypothetical protein